MESAVQPSDCQDRLWLFLLEEEEHPPDNDCRMQQEPQGLGVSVCLYNETLTPHVVLSCSEIPQACERSLADGVFMVPHGGTCVTPQEPSWCGIVIRGLHAT